MQLSNSELLPPAKKKSHRTIIILVILGMIAVPTVMLVFVFPWLSQSAFQSVDEIDVAQVDTIRIQFLNHPNRKADVDPVYLANEDFDTVLEPLRRAESVTVIPPSAHLGEYRIRFKDGRRGTIRLTWLQENRGQENALASLTGAAAMENGFVPPKYTVYFKIDSKMYKAGHAMELFNLGYRLAERGHK